MWKGLNPIDQCLHAFGVCRRVVGIVRDVRWDLSRAPVHVGLHTDRAVATSVRPSDIRSNRGARDMSRRDGSRTGISAGGRGPGPPALPAPSPIVWICSSARFAQHQACCWRMRCSYCVPRASGCTENLPSTPLSGPESLAYARSIGATRSELAGLLLGSGMGLLVGGLALGIALVVASAGLSARFLFDTSGSDPLILGVVVTILFLTGTSAMLVASRRATALDPAAALRAE